MGLLRPAALVGTAQAVTRLLWLCLAFLLGWEAQRALRRPPAPQPWVNPLREPDEDDAPYEVLPAPKRADPESGYVLLQALQRRHWDC